MDLLKPFGGPCTCDRGACSVHVNGAGKLIGGQYQLRKLLKGDFIVQTKLGKILRKLRIKAGLTLQQVEKHTKIGNGYISQIETGRVKQPALQMIYSLAELYMISFESLVKIGGYVRKKKKPGDPHTVSGHTFLAAAMLTKKEEQEIWDYLHFMRERAGLKKYRRFLRDKKVK